MNAADFNKTLVEGYLSLLENLSVSSKLTLISRLTESMKSKSNKGASSFAKAFGAFQSNQTADEIIEDIRQSRKFNREIEDF